MNAVLSTIMPFVTPLTSYAFIVGGSVVDSKGEGNAIRTAAFDAVGAASTLMSPVTGVVAILMK